MAPGQVETKLSYKLVDSPIGVLRLVASEKGLVAILWKTDKPRRVRLGEVVEEPSHPVLVRTEKELKEYFAGKRRVFSIPLDVRGTPFQNEVWGALLGIPFGETRSYGDLAKRLGNPAASRAVGAANGRNPVAIIVPCHRVVGATGSLTGFAGGLEAKAYLLSLEGSRTVHLEAVTDATDEVHP
jgi:methylated-DNA-[protein]-cysteine S-methyltransferase